MRERVARVPLLSLPVGGRNRNKIVPSEDPRDGLGSGSLAQEWGKSQTRVRPKGRLHASLAVRPRENDQLAGDGIARIKESKKMQIKQKMALPNGRNKIDGPRALCQGKKTLAERIGKIGLVRRLRGSVQNRIGLLRLWMAFQPLSRPAALAL